MSLFKELKERWLVENANNALPANDEDLLLFQKNNNVALPKDLIEYFRLLNGTGGECTNDLYEFYSIDRIKKVKEEFKDWKGVPNYQQLSDVDEISELYVFANFNFNLFAYAISLYPAFSNTNEVYILCGEQHRKIANSFHEFVKLYLSDSIELQFND